MPRASKYGTIDSAAAAEEAASVVRPVLLVDASDRLRDDGLSAVRGETHRWRKKNAAWATLGICAAAAVLGLAYSAQPTRNSRASLINVSPSASAAATEELGPLSFEAVNFYHVRDGKPAQLYPWLRDVKLIEPHRETTLSISSPRDGHDYIWEVRGPDGDEEGLRASARGAEADVVLTELDENMFTVKEVNAAGEVVRTLEETVMVKYVRREIRTLTDDEREELFDAVRPSSVRGLRALEFSVRATHAAAALLFVWSFGLFCLLRCAVRVLFFCE